MDSEYIILDEIKKNERVTQRELSAKTRLSLGSVNILLNKMAREGLIKLKHIPMNRVVYMLTPKGIAEKAKKTYEYINLHYRYINETSEKVRNIMTDLVSEKETLYIWCHDDEFSLLIKSLAQNMKNAVILKSLEDVHNGVVLVSTEEEYTQLLQKGYKVLNLLHYI